MRPLIFIRALLSASIGFLTLPLGAQPAARIDRAQAEVASRILEEGDTVRLYCKSCSEVAYTAVTVRSWQLRPKRRHYEILLNGEPEEAARIYVDDGYGDGWENLAVLLGLVVEGPLPKLPTALDDVAGLAPHAGSYTGQVGGVEARLELVLTGRKLEGTWTRLEDGVSFQLLATAYNQTRGGKTLTLVERGEKDRVNATLHGDLDAEAGTFIGSRRLLGSEIQETFRLKKP